MAANGARPSAPVHTPDRSRRPADLLLRGRSGAEGFFFHDGYDQVVHRAAPGILGLLEGRAAMQRWKPTIVEWLDASDHFFNHVLHELRGQPGFPPVEAEIEAVRSTDAFAAVRSRLLFRYLADVAGELERREVSERDRSSGPPLTRLPSRRGPGCHTLGGAWEAYYREGEGVFARRQVELPVNWELLPGISNYAGTMRFTRIVRVPAALAGRRLVMVFRGVDYFADLWVNGHHAGGHEGPFGPFELDVTPFVDCGGDNVVRLAVTSPDDPAGDGTHVTSGWDDFRPSSSFPNRKTLVKGTLGHHDAKRGGAWSALTSQDGNTGGVWNDLAVHVREAVHLDPNSARVAVLALTPGPAAGTHQAAVRVTVSVRNATDHATEGRLVISLRPTNFEGPSHRLARTVTLQPGSNEVVVERTLSAVRAWEPWDQGFPHLYRVSGSIRVDGHTSDRIAFTTGLRILAVSPVGESSAPDGAFVVNGGRVRVRGTNVLPTYWLSEFDDDTAERDFRMLREAGFNTILVHNLVGPQRLYDAADRHGFMVVQMFPLQWSYEQSPALVARAADQVREMARLLYNHPSVVSYETHNEPDMRTAHDLDNRYFDFDLHAVLREEDPTRWATTFSGGNHAYPGQFYALRDDNSFATLPARFLESEFAGRRISRHHNLPTEFGIQAMPDPDLFGRILSEERVVAVLRRIHLDPKWVAAGGEPWDRTAATIAAVKEALGGGSWEEALHALDWRHLSRMDRLEEEAARLEALPGAGHGRQALSLRLALLILEVLHYGGFKGENFWFGLWRPSPTMDGFVAASQDRQYRLHKDAIENFLNAGVVGPMVGYISFMFRDPDWQAPTWGVVGALGTPKKAYRAYVESNQPVRVSLPGALGSPVRLAGDRWFAASTPQAGERKPWRDSALIVANDGAVPLIGARVTVRLEGPTGAKVPFVDGAGREMEVPPVVVDLPAGSGTVWPDERSDDPLWRPVVQHDLAPGTYGLYAAVATAEGETLSTNRYEVLVPDTAFAWLRRLSAADVRALVDGFPGAVGFQYWDQGRLVHLAAPGVRGLIEGFAQATEAGADVYDVVQGEHVFRHLVAELAGAAAAGDLMDAVWLIRSETISPAEKTAVVLRYLGRFVEQADKHLVEAAPGPAPTGSGTG